MPLPSSRVSPRVQEEELRNHATEGLNVTKLGLEGRIRELEGAVEAQHRVGSPRCRDTRSAGQPQCRAVVGHSCRACAETQGYMAFFL